MTTPSSPRPTCFIAMPMTTRPHEIETYGGDSEHWLHVMRHLFVPAIEQAGFEAIEPTARGSDMIHSRIIENLSNADMVLCDLSGWNPNVFFELGVRTSLNKPIALVRDEKTDIPFDTNGLNTHRYASALTPWEMPSEVDAISAHLKAAEASCDGQNPMWRRFGLELSAEQPVADPSSTEARIELILEQINDMRLSQEATRQADRERMISGGGIALATRATDEAGAEIKKLFGAKTVTVVQHPDQKVMFLVQPVEEPNESQTARIHDIAHRLGLEVEQIKPLKAFNSLTLLMSPPRARDGLRV